MPIEISGTVTSKVEVVVGEKKWPEDKIDGLNEEVQGYAALKSPKV